MKSIILAVLLLLSFVSSAFAETVQGYDVLALAKYCKQYLNAPPLPAVSTLLNTFGDPLPCIEKRIQKGGLKVVQIDLIDATCWRNNKCPAGVPRPDDLKAITKRGATIQPLAAKYPEIEFWAVPALEHDIRDPKKVEAMTKAAKTGCPLCKVLNSPFTGAKIPGVPLELHGTKVRAFSVSGDGASSYDGDNIKDDGNGFQHRTSGEEQTYAWWNELNLRCTGEKDFTPPLNRTEKPTADQFEQAYLTFVSPEPIKPNAPAQCKGVRDIQQGKEITKPNAESYCNGQQKDPRGNKPLLIIRVPGKRGDRMNVLSAAGKQVGAFCYYGTYPELPGTHRWYMGNCSGQAPAKLYHDLGGEWGFVKLRDGSCLRFNSIRRQGTYR